MGIFSVLNYVYAQITNFLFPVKENPPHAHYESYGFQYHTRYEDPYFKYNPERYNYNTRTCSSAHTFKPYEHTCFKYDKTITKE